MVIDKISKSRDYLSRFIFIRSMLLLYSLAMSQPFTLTKEQIRLLLFYDFRNQKKTADSITDINSAFGTDTVSKSTAYDWYARFKKGNENLNDLPRSGRPSEFDNSVLKEALRSTAGRRRASLRTCLVSPTQRSSAIWLSLARKQSWGAGCPTS